jgi:hypothetical protein
MKLLMDNPAIDFHYMDWGLQACPVSFMSSEQVAAYAVSRRVSPVFRLKDAGQAAFVAVI